MGPRGHSEELWVFEAGLDLSSTLRRTWGTFPKAPAHVIAQAIELGLGTEKAREVLAALETRLTTGRPADTFEGNDDAAR